MRETFDEVMNPAGDSQSLRMSTVRSGAFALGAEGVDFLLRLSSIVVLARLLDPAAFGIVGMVTAVTMVAERFKDLGLMTATIQRPRITQAEASTLFWVNAGVGVLTCGAVAALAYPLSLFYSDARLVPVTLAISTTFVWSGAANLHHSLLRRSFSYGRIAAIQLVASVVSIGLAVALAWYEFGFWALVAREVTRNVLLAVGAWVLLPWVPGAPAWQPGVPGMLRFGADVTGFNLAYLISGSLDQALVGKAFGAHSLGLYRQGFQLVFAPVSQLTNPIRVVAESVLCRLQTDPAAFRRYYQRILVALALPTIPLTVFVAVLADSLVKVVLGPAWIDAVPAVRVLALAALPQPALATLGAVMLACGHSRRFLRIGLLSSTVLVLFYVMGLPFGVVGVASAHLWTVLLLVAPRLYWSFRDTPVSVPLFLTALIRPVSCSVAMAGVLLLFREARPIDGLSSLIQAMVVGSLVYSAAWLAIPGGRAELAALVSAVSGPLGLSQFLERMLQTSTEGRVTDSVQPAEVEPLGQVLGIQGRSSRGHGCDQSRPADSVSPTRGVDLRRLAKADQAPAVTVILCTYNRSRMLRTALDSLTHVDTKRNWEVIVVDNNSSDGTQAVAEEYCQTYPGRFRYIFEPRQGKSHALNRGIQESRGGILAFTDDDVRVDQRWLDLLVSRLDDPTWAGVGGRVLPDVAFSPRPWMSLDHPHFRAPLVMFDLGGQAGPMHEAPFGANMAFRREVFERRGGFRIDLGPCPGSTVRSEDTEFGTRLLAAGEALWYEPAAAVYHAVPPERLRKRYFLGWWYGKGRAEVRESGVAGDERWSVAGVPLVFVRRLLVWLPRWALTLRPADRFNNKLKVWSLWGTICEAYDQAKAESRRSQRSEFS
jgi:PST family polysaccharide transporter